MDNSTQFGERLKERRKSALVLAFNAAIALSLLKFSSTFTKNQINNRTVGAIQRPSYISNNPQPKATLKPFRKQAPFSGPYHLNKLYGKCFSLTDHMYSYELCPFFNITQQEQTYRWNAFKGILGVWKEWSIVNNTFEAMVMSDGDQCPGDLRRQSKVFLICGKSNNLVSVKEPRVCRYEVTFTTPLACPIDAFLVYPALSVAAQKEWEEIEESLYHEELTMQGYEKRRHRLFVHAGFLAPPAQQDKTKNNVVKDTLSEVKSNSFVPNNKFVKKFNTKQECSQAYFKLLRESLKLRELLEKYNSSEETSRISHISNVEFPTINSVPGQARGDTGTINSVPGTHIQASGPSVDVKKLPLTNVSMPSSPGKQFVVPNSNTTMQTLKHIN